MTSVGVACRNPSRTAPASTTVVSISFLFGGGKKAMDGVAAEDALHERRPIALAQLVAIVDLNENLDLAGVVVECDLAHVADLDAGTLHGRAGRDALGVVEMNRIGASTA